MRISAIIPSYNRRHTLERALQSVFAQTSPVDEVILVDDGSSDDSAEMTAQRFPDVKVIRQSNRGVSAARNRGIRAARHDWIALLDSLAQRVQGIRRASAWSGVNAEIVGSRDREQPYGRHRQPR